MSYPAFILAVFILLLSPGPTNTLMGLAAARDGFWRVPKLLPAELSGYLTTILPLVWLGDELVSRWPGTTLILKAAAAIWVMYLAANLWIAGNNDNRDGSVTARRIYLTTMLNPKALVIGLVFLPRPTAPDFLSKLILVTALASIVAIIWAMVGGLIQASAKNSRIILIQRVASVWLVILACGPVLDLFRA
ncbi:LysE family translocator [Agrobacterium deltaense]